MTDTKTKPTNTKGALTYLLGPITGLYFIFTEKKDEYIRFHAMQSTVLFGGIFLLYIVLGIIPVLGWLVAAMISPILSLISFILWLVLMYKAYNGEKYKLPYIGEIAEKQLTKLK
jgi:uncharacterized membrane protein